jgi:DNA-binding response OmpR family regulator
MSAPCILVVDDDETLRELVCAILGDEGYQAVAVPDLASGLSIVRTIQPKLILLDSMMDRQDFDSFVTAYRQSLPPHTPIYLFTAASDGEERALEWHLEGVLIKPFEIEELVALAVRYGCEKQVLAT